MACPRLTAAPRSSDVHTYNQQSLVVDEYRHVFAPAALVPARGARGRRKVQPAPGPRPPSPRETFGAADGSAFEPGSDQVIPQLGDLRWRIATELPRGQARVALGLLCLPVDPVAYSDIAAAFGISLGTVHTHLRRIYRRRPDRSGNHATLTRARSTRRTLTYPLEGGAAPWRAPASPPHPDLRTCTPITSSRSW